VPLFPVRYELNLKRRHFIEFKRVKTRITKNSGQEETDMHLESTNCCQILRNCGSSAPAIKAMEGKRQKMCVQTEWSVTVLD
jgi:hypothetical protein